MTASMREWSCSFSSRLRTWFLTVFSLMNSCLAISRLFMPLATRRSTSSSRSVRRRPGTAERSGRDICLNSSMSLTAIDGLISDCPSATTPTALAGLGDGGVLERVARGAALDGLVEVGLLVGGGEHDDLGGRHGLLDLLAG